MKISTLFAFTSLGATVLAAPLSPFGGVNGLERRFAQPVRRTDSPSATATPTDSPTDSATAAPTATPTDSASPTNSLDSTDAFFYSTISNTDSFTYTPATQTLAPSTGGISTTTTTEYPQSTGSNGSGSNGSGSNGSGQDSVNINVSETTIIRIKEVVQVTQVLLVEKPIFIAVQPNIIVRKTIIVNQIQNVFINRFDNWDINVIEQLSIVLSQQYDILIRSTNLGFQGVDNGSFNEFVSKFITQFQVFQSFQLVDVQQFVTVLQGFSINQLATFFGRSDILFSETTFTQFNINNSFTIFVQQLPTMITSISSSPFNTDGIFNLSNDPLLNAQANVSVNQPAIAALPVISALPVPTISSSSS